VFLLNSLNQRSFFLSFLYIHSKFRYFFSGFKLHWQAFENETFQITIFNECFNLQNVDNLGVFSALSAIIEFPNPKSFFKIPVFR
jgi:hypothetical protein